MVEDYTLAYLPSAALLINQTSRPELATSLLAVAPGRTRLRHALEEVRSLTALFHPQSRMLIGRGASESSFKVMSEKYRMLHLATHGYFNKLNPLLSGLELEPDDSNDGLLEVHEILKLRLNADLVTLSACQTGLGSGYFAEVPAGDDFVGLTRAFLHAGSASVLATLWKVDDLSTVKLMESFYRQVRQRGNGEGKAIALARAQRELWASASYGHPYFWAPFVLIGAVSEGIQKESKVKS
jgi:CHAT domain-containing protein